MHNSAPPARQSMELSGILGTTFSLYRKHLLLFLAVSFPRFCGELVEYLLGRFLPNFPLKDPFIDLIDMLFAIISVCGIIVVTAVIYLGGRMTSIQALKQTGHRFWHVWAWALVWGLAFNISSTGILFTSLSLIDPVPAWTPDSPVTDPLYQLSFVFMFVRLAALPFSICLQTPVPWWDLASDLLFFSMKSGELWRRLIPLVLVPFSIYFAVRWTFTAPAVLLEESRIRRAFERSRDLARGKWWRVWGLLICFSILSFAIQQIVQIAVGCILVFTKLTDVTNLMEVIRWVLRINLIIDADVLFYEVIGWTDIVVKTLIFPMWFIGITLLYFDLRMRKDGVHIEIPINNTANGIPQ